MVKKRGLHTSKLGHLTVNIPNLNVSDRKKEQSTNFMLHSLQTIRTLQ